ncbi:MAG: LamG-like jellyroll fold domain-containing protein [Armatimonadota bacterium]
MKYWITAGILIMMIHSALFSPAFGASTKRTQLLKSADAYWRLNEKAPKAKYPLASVGKVEYITEKDSYAHLTDAYFNAGNKLTVTGDKITIYLHARDPRGLWSYGLFNKRGNHSIMNFNLFSADLPGTEGPDIGFELNSEAGFTIVRFPVSMIDPTAWHDIVGRYDGKTIEIICDGTVMAKKDWNGGNLTQNTEPVLIGAETENGNIIRPFTGDIQEAAIWSRALNDKEISRLMRKDTLMPDTSYAPAYDSPIHFRPKVGNLADNIPFYWNGEYHVFYLLAKGKVQWEHIVSKDLVHWTVLPPALVSDGPPDSPDGMHMFTGSVIEKDGLFYIFYTGHNPNNPNGLEFIIKAVSRDLIHWTKYPESIIEPDGTVYRIGKKSNPANPWSPYDWDFRDPYVFFNEDEKCYWMVILADDAKSVKQVQGLLTSPDLLKWEVSPPLQNTPGQECPDLFKIGDIWYLIGGDNRYFWSKDPKGPYKEGLGGVLDWPFIYAAKRMFDGKRHIWVGWLWDRDPANDQGARQWGGTMNLPREIYAGQEGMLYSRPVQEVIDVFNKTVFDLSQKPGIESEVWKYKQGVLSGASEIGTQCRLDAPDNYMLECTVELDPNAVFTLIMRDQLQIEDNYRLRK